MRPRCFGDTDFIALKNVSITFPKYHPHYLIYSMSWKKFTCKERDFLLNVVEENDRVVTALPREVSEASANTTFCAQWMVIPCSDER